MDTQKEPKKTAKRIRRIKKPAERELFCQFVSLPRVLREEEFGYKNMGDFAKEHKINPTTLSAWMHETGIQDKIKKNWQAWGRDRTPDVVLALYRTAVKEGRASEAKAWMQIVEEWEEKVTQSNPDLDKIASALERLASTK